MTGELYITDGTTYINLLSGIDGFRLVGWTPRIPPAKQVWRESPLSDGRKLAMSKWANATETFALRVSRFTQDDIIEDLQDLRRLLMQAREYFIGGSDTPVWIQARGDCETNTRYAVICDWRAETDDDPHTKPFLLDHPVVDGFVLILERQHWRHLPPGQSECVELSATQDYYDEQTDDFVPTESGDDCYVDTVGATISLILNVRFGRTAGSAAIYGSGVRFRNVTIPQGADIIRAYVLFHAEANLAANDVKVIISCDDVDNAAIFSTFADFTGRARTTAHTHWGPIAAWVSGNDYYSADLGPAVQEVVNRAGWASGNSLAVLFDDDTSTAAATRTAEAWDAAGVNEPQLEVYWFDSATRTFGRTATCNNEVYIANKHNVAQLTHIFVDDGGVFGANLIGAALPYALYPAAPAVNDAVYFGIATAAPDSGPFDSLVFDIGTINDSDTIAWEYWNAGWVALTVRDNTSTAPGVGQPFSVTGVNSVHWIPPSDWVTTAVNGTDAYWVRARVTAIGGAAQAATQQNRDVYTVVTPFIDAMAATVLGDIQALGELILEGQSGIATVGLITNEIFAGLRSYDRGDAFTAYFNIADEQNQTGITARIDSASVAWANDISAPSGRCATWTAAGAAANESLINIEIGNSVANDYHGVFRCFLRLKQTAGTNANALFSLRQSIGNTLNYLMTTGQKSPSASNEFVYIDFGKITIPAMIYESGDLYNSYYLSVFGQSLGAVTVSLYDLIILPADECLICMNATPIPGSSSESGYLRLWYTNSQWFRVDADSTIPRIMLRAEVIDQTNLINGPWATYNNSPLIWQPNERQRWWIFQHYHYSATDYARPPQGLSAQGWEVSRYLSMRGDR